MIENQQRSNNFAYATAALSVPSKNMVETLVIASDVQTARAFAVLHDAIHVLVSARAREVYN